MKGGLFGVSSAEGLDAALLRSGIDAFGANGSYEQNGLHPVSFHDVRCFQKSCRMPTSYAVDF